MVLGAQTLHPNQTRPIAIHTDELVREEISEPDATDEEGDDLEGREVEGYMLDFGALRDELGKKEEEKPQQADPTSSDLLERTCAFSLSQTGVSK